MPTVPVLPSGRSDAETKSLRHNTSAFIAANPSMIALIPRTRVKSGTGIAWIDEDARPVQVLRLIDQSSSRSPTPGVVVSSDGQERKAEYQLLGTWDSEIGLYDYWISPEGWRHEVAQLLPYNGYEVRVLVVRYGQ